jgi:hypothetical protein
VDDFLPRQRLHRAPPVGARRGRAARPPAGEALQSELERLEADAESVSDPKELVVPLTDRERAEMRALGYIFERCSTKSGESQLVR